MGLVRTGGGQRARRPVASSTIHMVMMDADDGAQNGRPLRTARRLTSAAREMKVASPRLIHAQRELAAASEAPAVRIPAQGGDAPELMELAAARCQAVAGEIPSHRRDAIGGCAAAESQGTRVRKEAAG